MRWIVSKRLLVLKAVSYAQTKYRFELNAWALVTVFAGNEYGIVIFERSA